MVSRLSIPGIGSGIDSARLADALYDQLTMPNLIRDNQLDSLKSETTALESFRELMLGLADQLDSLRSANGGANIRSAQSSNTDVLTVAADSSAQFGAVDINVESLAQSASGSFDRSFDSRVEFLVQDASQTGSVNFTIGEGSDAKTFQVQVGELTTAEGFVEQFNAAADGNASASLVNLGTENETSYRILFQTSGIGTEKGSLDISVDNDAMLGSDVLNGITLTQATDAKFSVSGVSGSVIRDSNTISDVISGVTFQLNSVGAATVSVQQDSDAAASQVENFVSAYNSIVEYVKKEDLVTTTKVDGENVNTYGSLARTNVDDRAIEAIRSAIHSAMSSEGSVSLAALGVSTERDGTLSFDQEKFQEVFNNDPEAAREVITSLADSISGVQGVVHQYTGYGNAIDDAIATNETTSNQISGTIERVERTASAQQDTRLSQFGFFEKLIAQLNADASVIASLLTF